MRYPEKTYAFRSFFTKVITIPMLFSGGMIANYLVMTKVLMLKNTIWALILPLAMNSFNVIVLRTFFKTSIPDSVVESAKIDGASEWRLFFPDCHSNGASGTGNDRIVLNSWILE